MNIEFRALGGFRTDSTWEADALQPFINYLVFVLFLTCFSHPAEFFRVKFYFIMNNFSFIHHEAFLPTATWYTLLGN
jgi:hypothetical protein